MSFVRENVTERKLEHYRERERETVINKESVRVGEVEKWQAHTDRGHPDPSLAMRRRGQLPFFFTKKDRDVLSLSLAPAKPPIPPFSPGREPVTRNADETHPTNILGRSQTHLTLHTLDRALPDLTSPKARSTPPPTPTPSGEEIRPCLYGGECGSGLKKKA